jgi:hypothetical protein
MSLIILTVSNVYEDLEAEYGASSIHYRGKGVYVTCR